MRRTRSAAAFAALACLCAAPPASALPADSLLVNGSFEEPVLAQGAWWIFPNPGVPGWGHAPARAGVTSAGIEIQNHRGGSLVAPGGGDQFVELDSDGPSRVFQDVATAPGMGYRLTFLWSPRPNTSAAQNNFTVGAAGTTATFGPAAGGTQAAWAPAALDFDAAGAQTRIEFTDLGPEEAGNAGLGAYVDEVALVPVYDLCLMYDPAKAHKAGSTVPIKLRICDSIGANLSSEAHVLHATALTKVDSSASSTVEDSGQANPDDDFRYSPDLAGYIFNLSTKGLTMGTWRLSFTIDGGSTTYAVTFDVR